MPERRQPVTVMQKVIEPPAPKLHTGTGGKRKWWVMLEQIMDDPGSYYEVMRYPNPRRAAQIVEMIYNGEVDIPPGRWDIYDADVTHIYAQSEETWTAIVASYIGPPERQDMVEIINEGEGIA